MLGFGAVFDLSTYMLIPFILILSFSLFIAKKAFLNSLYVGQGKISTSANDIESLYILNLIRYLPFFFWGAMYLIDLKPIKLIFKVSLGKTVMLKLPILSVFVPILFELNRFAPTNEILLPPFTTVPDRIYEVLS